MRLATMADLDDLVGLFQGAQRWLAEKGSDQWAANTPERTRAKLAHSIESKECYVAELDGKSIGMMTLDEFADPEFWRPADRPDVALYLPRMVVDRSVAGNSVGGKLLDLAESVAAAQGKGWLRLDAWRTNTPLHVYYERQGFDSVRVIILGHRGSGALFQRRVKTSTGLRPK
jgi:GNAT superfamily N-acetyltransferase